MTPQQALEQGLSLHRAGRLTEAEPFYAAALRAEPELVPALHLMGVLRFQQQNFPVARALMEKLLAKKPASAETLFYYGMVVASQGEIEAGLAALGRAIAAAAPGNPILARALSTRSDMLRQLNRQEEAVADLDRAIALAPEAAHWNNRGLALIAMNRAEDALTSFDMAIALDPGAHQAHNNRGDVLRQLRRLDEAMASFSRALTINPRDWQAMNNRAIALSLMGRTDEAIAEYDRALAVEPNLPEALHARGNSLWSFKDDLGPALADLERLVAVAPGFAFAEGTLLRMEMTAARWDAFAARKGRLAQGIREGRLVVEPLIHLAISDSPAEQLDCARLYSSTLLPPRPPLAKPASRNGRRLRVGYVGGEFRNHAVGYLMVGLFEHHDRENFEITLFDSGGGDGSLLRARYEKAAEHIVNIGEMADLEAAELIAARKIDVLVDVAVYSGATRMGVFAHRAAPVQASYLGYPGTSGAPYMDYLLADRVVVPEADVPHYSEKIAWLPHSYQINDDKRPMAEPPSRAEAGLPEKVFVFASFNNVNKLTPETFSLWMRIVAATPGSVLWLVAAHPIAQDNLRREAEAQGVAGNRLIFAPYQPFAEHLARLTLADLSLDGLPYGAHTTANDALWAGVPHLTLRGKSFSGRVAASLLTAAKLPELITENPGDFEAEALRLAGDSQALKSLRAKVGRTKKSAPLFDTARTTRAVERAWRMMAERPAPESFLVPDD